MKYNYNKNTDSLLSIFSSDEFSIEEDKLIDSLKEISVYYSKNKRHQYHIISHFVYTKMEKGEDIVSYILNNIDCMLAFLSYRRKKSEKIIKENSELCLNDIILNLEKLYDHIALEEERLINNGNIISSSKNEIESNVINRFNSIFQSVQNKVDEISNSLNANIITVVGLFSAIIFVFFGGVTALSSVINGILALKRREDLTLPLIIILAVGFIMFNIIFLLLYSISKIVNKNIGSSVRYSSAWWYYVKEIEDNRYAVQRGDDRIKEFKERIKAEKYARKRIFFSKVKDVLASIGKRIFLRFPYVFIINAIILGGIIYLYISF